MAELPSGFKLWWERDRASTCFRCRTSRARTHTDSVLKSNYCVRISSKGHCQFFDQKGRGTAIRPCMAQRTIGASPAVLRRKPLSPLQPPRSRYATSKTPEVEDLGHYHAPKGPVIHFFGVTTNPARPARADPGAHMATEQRPPPRRTSARGGVRRCRVPPCCAPCGWRRSRGDYSTFRLQPLLVGRRTL